MDLGWHRDGRSLLSGCHSRRSLKSRASGTTGAAPEPTCSSRSKFRSSLRYTRLCGMTGGFTGTACWRSGKTRQFGAARAVGTSCRAAHRNGTSQWVRVGHLYFSCRPTPTSYSVDRFVVVFPRAGPLSTTLLCSTIAMAAFSIVRRECPLSPSALTLLGRVDNATADCVQSSESRTSTSRSVAELGQAPHRPRRTRTWSHPVACSSPISSVWGRLSKPRRTQL